MKTNGNNGQKIKKSMQLVILPPYVYHCGVDLPIITIIDFIIFFSNSVSNAQGFLCLNYKQHF